MEGGERALLCHDGKSRVRNMHDSGEKSSGKFGEFRNGKLIKGIDGRMQSGRRNQLEFGFMGEFDPISGVYR